MAKAASTPGTEVTFDNGPSFDDTILRDLDSFDAAIALTREKLGAELVPASEVMGNGFIILNGDDKIQLVGLPCIFMGWTFNLGDSGEFVSATVVAKSGSAMIKAIVNDGGTGICAQLREYTRLNSGKQGGLTALHGLRVSRYFVDGEGQKYKEGGPGRTAAATFYIDTSA